MVENGNTTNVTIAISQAYLDRISEVVKDLQQAGLKGVRTMSMLGIVTGSISSSDLQKLQQVKGVQKVEKSRRIQLPPSDSDIQ
jgi:hypothetical protein